MNRWSRRESAERGLAAARLALNAFVLAAAALPLYLLAKQAVTPELETFAWPPHWAPHDLTFSHFVTVFAVNELRSAVLRSLGVAAISALMTAHAKDEVLTGIFYVDTKKPSFTEMLNLVEEPLGTLPDERVRPGKAVLDEVMQRLM